MTVRVITMGCRLNTYESEVMAGEAERAGLGATVIVNTCAVTAEAVRQSAQAIRRARRETPEARIVVTGCAAQIEPDRFSAMPEVDHVVGNAGKTDAAVWAGIAAGATERVKVDDIMSVRETAGHLIDGFGTRARAYVQVQNGCDHRCTFCVIPFGRGPSRSVPAGEIVGQIRRIAERGYAEVVLTGVDITAYGADLPGKPTLGRLVRQILTLVPELPRLRLSSIDQVEADPDLMRALAEEERLMPHLHLSLQAGDDMILKRMRRRHVRQDALRFCAEARRLRPDVAFGADLIAGFPTESEGMFTRSLDLVDECGIAYLHVFPYSPRPGTAAARMPQVPRAVIKQRAARLRQKGEAALARHLDAQVGRSVTALIERESVGRTPDFAEVVVDGAGSDSLVTVALAGHDGRRLAGRVVA
ncbi:MAG: tRNA (N(6)-L-threonylcarbamoyladenosine(37)-C(2))-methylthiotransferase MtaB [Hyphomicrobiaceae bacterium]|nr:tRNA (N(6)-L-threonylcarbamoyladenosine(37)-C(2))-methylthiotransferase MtaB [Hyphomicrobiaceae bacterium]